MTELDLGAFDVLTFDCYGTLIDWEAGILASIQPILAAHDVHLADDEVLERYARHEAALEAGLWQSYRGVLAGALGGVAVGWSLIASFDYDGSASISQAEMMQDRFPPPGLAGAVTTGPAPALPPGANLAGQIGALKALIEELAPLLGLPGN